MHRVCDDAHAILSGGLPPGDVDRGTADGDRENAPRRLGRHDRRAYVEAGRRVRHPGLAFGDALVVRGIPRHHLSQHKLVLIGHLK